MAEKQIMGGEKDDQRRASDDMTERMNKSPITTQPHFREEWHPPDELTNAQQYSTSFLSP